ncbi:MAG: ABC transporter ATP-binding protein [Bacteroidales bacterium]|nr:ABC transporter ATP-binding protein [Bacteroidales bacterium]MCF8386494.1 ABC transporter ATP-binding protein [Bacteroidales bacterium]MCF8397102.1 ABC transporter ATP-binding protein [Bacteroidales bacterium]
MIRAENLTKYYGKTRGVEDISFSVDDGEIFGLIGPDGAGKTSLFRMLTTLLKPDKGKATVGELDVVKDYKKIRKKIGYMPGRFSLYQDLSVEENLAFYARIFNTTIQENYHLVKDIYQQIEPFRKRLAGNLSGGMKQKLALSCALIHSPEYLFLDEPTTGVDAVSRQEFWDMLENLQQKGITIMVSTPYMDEASLCDRVALIQKGSIFNINRPEGIISDFGRDLYALRSRDMFELNKDLKNYKNTHSAFRFGESIHFTAENISGEPESLRNYLIEKGHEDLKLEKTEAGIEDCFMDQMTAK